MNVLDSSGWLEYFTDGPNARFFAQSLSDPEGVIVPSICVYEVFKRLLQFIPEREATQYVQVMREARVVTLDIPIAMNAAKLAIKHKLAMADAIILATTRAYEATLWTQDAHFENIEGVKYVEKK